MHVGADSTLEELQYVYFCFHRSPALQLIMEPFDDELAYSVQSPIVTMKGLRYSLYYFGENRAWLRFFCF